MKTKLLLSALFGMAAWSLSSVAAANWEDGPCPQPHGGPAPCIEIVDGNDAWHFNGDGSHADVWHGLPDDLGGGDIQFSDDSVVLDCPDQDAIDCILTLSGQVKKCQDSNGDWRIGVRVTDANAQSGDIQCSFLTINGFPWYSKDPSIASHCPFEDNCDNFIPYDPSASTYTANFGNVSVSSFLGTYVDEEHLHGVTFTPGANASFNFLSKTFFDCEENEGCSIDGLLELQGADELNIY